MDKKKTYEEMSSQIDEELKKRRGSWFLKALPWMDYDDVCQIIRWHIYNKWDKWDQDKPLGPWVNTIISNQIKNILRDKYGKFARPCLRCDFNQGWEPKAGGGTVKLCGYTPSRRQCSECDLYAHWEKTKKHAYNVKLPVSTASHDQEIYNKPSEIEITEEIEEKLHNAMEKVLTPRQYIAYEALIIEGKEEEEVAKIMGFYSNEDSRKAGYRQIKNLTKIFKEKAVEVMEDEDILIYPKNKDA